MAPIPSGSAPSSDDTPMPDLHDDEEDEEEPVERIITLLPGSTDTAASFEFKNEDHTLGNALRHIIMKNPQVEFCGYSIPHPAEARMCLRIQTYDGVSAQDVLEKGLDDLMDLCDVVVDKFEAASQDWHTKNDAGQAPVFEGRLDPK